jgi:hypothetical protein
MEFYTLHREIIPFRIMYWFAAFLGLIAAIFLGLVIYNFGVAPIDNEPVVGWVFLGEFLLMGSLAILLLQFSTYELVLTPEGIIIKFGKIKRFIRWMEIDSYSLITNGTVLSSGGWKINLGPRGWYSQYTVFGKPRITVQLNTGKIKEVVFSTVNPEEAARVIKKQTGKSANPGAGGYSSWK